MKWGHRPLKPGQKRGEHMIGRQKEPLPMPNAEREVLARAHIPSSTLIESIRARQLNAAAGKKPFGLKEAWKHLMGENQNAITSLNALRNYLNLGGHIDYPKIEKVGKAQKQQRADIAELIAEEYRNFCKNTNITEDSPLKRNALLGAIERAKARLMHK